MFDSWAQVKSAVETLAGSFDPSLISGADAARVVAETSAISNMALAVCSLASARLADTGAWRSSGERSCAHYVAQSTGTTVSSAASSIDLGHKLPQFDATSSLARSGRLSMRQAAVIADAASVD